MTFRTLRTATLIVGCLTLNLTGCSNSGASTATPIPIASSSPPSLGEPNKCPAEYYGERYKDDPGYTPKYLRCSDLHEKLDNAIVDGSLERIKDLLNVGANVNGWYSHRYPPLYSAAMRGHKEIAEFLIENGALLDKGDSWGTTPLMAAVVYNHPDVVKLLIAKGAYICKSADGGTGHVRSALDIAVDEGFQEIKTSLIDAGAKNCRK